MKEKLLARLKKQNLQRTRKKGAKKCDNKGEIGVIILKRKNYSDEGFKMVI